MQTEDQVENPTPEQAAAAASAAQAAFEGEFPENAKPVAAKPDKPEPKAEKEEKAEVAPDPKLVQQAAEKAQADEAARVAAEKEWDGVPAKVRQMLEGISGKVSELDKIDHRLKGVEGRAGAALNQVEALKTALVAAKDTARGGGAAPTPEQIAAAAKSNVKWKEVQENYPDWAEAMEERLAAFQPGAAKDVDVAGLQKDLRQIVVTATAEAKAEARELAKIDRRHENWEETINTPEFTTWRNAQPPEIQALGASTKAADAIKMLDAFDAHLKAVAEATAKVAANKKRLEGAVQPKGGGAPAGTRNLSDEAATQQGFNSVFTT